MLSPLNWSAALLDLCIDDLLRGRDWSQRLPADREPRVEIEELMEVAVVVRHLAAATAGIEQPARHRLWSRIRRDVRPVSKLRAFAFYRLPYLPPLWIRPEAC